jgi:hypothetical protein
MPGLNGQPTELIQWLIKRSTQIPTPVVTYKPPAIPVKGNFPFISLLSGIRGPPLSTMYKQPNIPHKFKFS